MIPLVLSDSPRWLVIWPIIGLVLFVAVFVLMLFWIFRPGSKKTYAARSYDPMSTPENKS